MTVKQLIQTIMHDATSQNLEFESLTLVFTKKKELELLNGFAYDQEGSWEEWEPKYKDTYKTIKGSFNPGADPEELWDYGVLRVSKASGKSELEFYFGTVEDEFASDQETFEGKQKLAALTFKGVKPFRKGTSPLMPTKKTEV